MAVSLPIWNGSLDANCQLELSQPKKVMQNLIYEPLIFFFLGYFLQFFQMSFTWSTDNLDIVGEKNVALFYHP